MRIAQISPPHLIALLILSICLMQNFAAAREQQTPGKEMMRIGDEIVSPEAGKLFVKAQEYLDNNQFEDASKILKQFLSTYPNSSAGHYKYGYALLQEGKNSEAMEQAKRCTKLNAGFSGGWALLGEAAMNLKLKQEAINAYEKALAIQSSGENAEVIREHLSELRKPEQGVSDDTVEKNREIVRQNDAIMKVNRALSLCDEANALAKQKQFEAGLQKCREAMKMQPDSAQVKENFATYLNNYASDCVQQENLKQAELLMKEAVVLLQSSGGVSRSTRLTTLKNYAALLKFLGQDADAKQIEAQMQALTQ